MPKFEVGDYVLCVKDNTYSCTNENSICRVERDEGDMMTVKITHLCDINGRGMNEVGHCYSVRKEYFMNISKEFA